MRYQQTGPLRTFSYTILTAIGWSCDSSVELLASSDNLHVYRKDYSGETSFFKAIMHHKETLTEIYITLTSSY